MRIEIPALPEPVGYAPREVHLSLTGEEATKLSSIRAGMFEANCKHSGVCEILSVADVIHCWIQSAIVEGEDTSNALVAEAAAEDALRADEPEAVAEDAPHADEPAPI